MRLSLMAGSAGLVLVASLVSGCADYDYLQRTDRVSYRAGDAVAANIEGETINPSSPWIYDTSGLGKNGSVMPKDAQTPAGGTAPGTSPTASP
jgi:hypothetical protein